MARFHTRVAHSPKMSWIYRSIAGYNVVSLMLGSAVGIRGPGLQTANGLGARWFAFVGSSLCQGLLLRRSQTTKPNHQVTIDWFVAFGRNNFSETYFWGCELMFLPTIVQIGEWVPPRQVSFKSSIDCGKGKAGGGKAHNTSISWWISSCIATAGRNPSFFMVHIPSF